MWLDITEFEKEWSREMYLFQIGLKLGVPDEPLSFCSFSKLDFTYMTRWQQWIKTLWLERNMNFSGTLQYQIFQFLNYSAWSRLCFSLVTTFLYSIRFIIFFKSSLLTLISMEIYCTEWNSFIILEQIPLWFTKPSFWLTCILRHFLPMQTCLYVSHHKG